MKNYALQHIIIVFGILVALISCKEENPERYSEKTVLDTKFKTEWYAESLNPDANTSIGELKYSITSNTISKVSLGEYDYLDEKTILLSNGVFQVEGSTNDDMQYFYVKEGKNENEIMVSLKNPTSSFERGCLDSYLCMAGLPKSFVFDGWHQLGANAAQQSIVFENNGVRINSDKKYFEVFSEMFNKNYFKLMSALVDSTDISTAIFLEQKYGEDSIRISEFDSLSFKTYYRYSGSSVGEVSTSDGKVFNSIGSSNWEENEKDVQIDTYTEKARTDWTVVLVNDNTAGEIEIDVQNKVVNKINQDDSRTKIADIISLENRW